MVLVQGLIRELDHFLRSQKPQHIAARDDVQVIHSLMSPNAHANRAM